MDINSALQEATQWMDKYDGVIGIAEGEHAQAPCITVFVNNPDIANKLPEKLYGFAVIVEISDTFLTNN